MVFFLTGMYLQLSVWCFIMFLYVFTGQLGHFSTGILSRLHLSMSVSGVGAGMLSLFGSSYENIHDCRLTKYQIYLPGLELYPELSLKALSSLILLILNLAISCLIGIKDPYNKILVGLVVVLSSRCVSCDSALSLSASQTRPICRRWRL